MIPPNPRSASSAPHLAFGDWFDLLARSLLDGADGRKFPVATHRTPGTLLGPVGLLLESKALRVYQIFQVLY
ncbi:MAG: hypothetical protein DMG06_12940 [Acidobacteria bacterium]|nr:MAG: hypothetical protein DMG06_12940 [Acidobacteriota bacterium]